MIPSDWIRFVTPLPCSIYVVLRIEAELGNARQALKPQAGTEGVHYHLLAIREILKEDKES